MLNNDRLIHIIFQAIDELNEQLPKEERLEKTVDMKLFGSGGKLDSLRLVSLITTLEQKIEEDLGASVSIFDHMAVSEIENPFMTIHSLADFLAALLENR